MSSTLNSTPLVSSETCEYIDHLRTKYGIMGAAIGVVADTESGWVTELKAFGVADAKGNEVTTESIFPLASNSKVFAAVCVALLIERETTLSDGKMLDFPTKVKDILPEWKLKDDYASERIDVMDLLIHRTGLSSHACCRSNSMMPSETVAKMRHLSFQSELRQEFVYSNTVYLVLAHIVATVSHMSYPEFLKKNVFDPLGMDSATQDSFEAKRSGKRTDGFIRSGLDRRVGGSLGVARSMGWWTDTDGVWHQGAGGIAMNIKDSAKWVKELLHPEKVLSTQLISQLNQGHILFMKASSPEHGAKLYGLGQWSTTYRGIDTVSHTGSIHGHLSVIMRVPSRRIGFWVNVNDEDFGGSFNTVITNRLLDTLLGLDPIDWETRSFAPSLDKRILPPPESAHPRPPPMDVSILGTFFDPGYDSLVIQPLTDSKLARGFADVVTKGGMTLDLEGDGKIYFTRMDKLFLTHILFRHLDGPRFEWIRTIMFRALDGDGQITDDWIGRYYGRGQAVVTREGIGMFGGFWGVPGSKGLNVVEEDVELGAEVWFARVGV